MSRPAKPARRIACITVPPSTDQRVWGQMLEILRTHSPLVEECTSPAQEGSLAYLDAKGILPRYPSEDAWSRQVLAEIWQSTQVKGRLGLAGSKFAAWIAAQMASPEPGYQIITQPDHLFLAPLAVTWLPLSAGAQHRLHLLGIRTMEQFGALPEIAVVEQFGPENAQAYRWAKGLDDRPVIGQRHQVAEAHHEFEVPETRYQAVLDTVILLLNRALQDLPDAARGWAIQRVELEAQLLKEHSIRCSALLDGTPGPQTWRILLANMVDSLRGKGSGITDLDIKLTGLEPSQGKQLNLFAHTGTRMRLEQTLRQLVKKHSASCVVEVFVLDEDAPLIAERYTFREYRP